MLRCGRCLYRYFLNLWVNTESRSFSINLYWVALRSLEWENRILSSRTNNSPVLDSMSYCTIELSIGLVLYLKDINPTTALICILKKESRINEGKDWSKDSLDSWCLFDIALVEVNLNILKQNIQELFLANSNSSPRQQRINPSMEWFERCFCAFLFPLFFFLNICIVHFSFLLFLLLTISIEVNSSEIEVKYSFSQ